MHYPIFLDLAGQRVAVIGAGRVAARKIRHLLEANAAVTVISPKAAASIQQLARAKRLRWLRRAYRSGDLRGARLAVAATDNETVNRRVCAEARRRKMLVNCAAPPDAGNFIVPSLVRRGPLTIAVSTGGASPALARQIRRDLAGFVTDGYAEAAKTMQALRKTTARAAESAQQRARLYRRALKRLLKSA